MRLSLSIAIRFLRSGRGQTFLIIMGIAIGVSVQVFIGSLIIGLQNSLVNATIGSSSQLTVTSESEDKAIKGWKRTLYEIGLFGDRVRFVSMAADGNGLADTTDGTSPILIRGLELSEGDNIYKFSKKLTAGVMDVGKDEAIIGTELSDKSGVDVGENIYITMPDGRSIKYRVKGIFDLNVSALNKTWVVTDLETAQEALGLDGKVTSIEMQVADKFSADELADEMRATLSVKDLRVDDWKSLNRQLLSGLNGQSVSSYMIQVFVLIAVLLGISSVLAISVVQRSKQIGILKAMGIRDGDASLIFVFQGLILGALGATIGIILGFGLLKSFTIFAVNPDGTPVVPVTVDPVFLTASGLIAIASSVVASLIPARLSSRLNPIEVIKNG